METLGHEARRLRQWAERLPWWLARGAVDAVRYRPRHLELVLACGAGQPGVPEPLARWLVSVPGNPAVIRATHWPHAIVRAVAGRAAAWFGPTASALVRWFSGAAAAGADHLSAGPFERRLRARAHPGLLVPHPHTLAVLAVDMRGFSNLTLALDDTQYLADLMEEYLTELTKVVELDRGIVFQYTGDGLLALFLPELAGLTGGALLERLVNETTPALHRTFDALHARWRAEWRARGRDAIEIGLGVGLSFGEATIGFIGPSGKKQFGVLGAPANLAAFLCAEAEAGTVLVDRGSFMRAGGKPPPGETVRLRSKKLRERVETVRLRHGMGRGAAFRRLPAPA